MFLWKINVIVSQVHVKLNDESALKMRLTVAHIAIVVYAALIKSLKK